MTGKAAELLELLTLELELETELELLELLELLTLEVELEALLELVELEFEIELMLELLPTEPPLPPRRKSACAWVCGWLQSSEPCELYGRAAGSGEAFQQGHGLCLLLKSNPFAKKIVTMFSCN